MPLDITSQVVMLGGLLALVLGALSNRINFCTMGSVSDWVNMGDTGRIRVWFLAITVALCGLVALEAMGIVDPMASRVPYRRSLFFWPRYLLGGFLFGVGMTLASGCGSKCLVRIGGGNIKSVFVLAVTGATAYLMSRTDLYAKAFHNWMEPISPDLATLGFSDQSLGTILGTLAGAESPSALNLYVGISLGIVFLILIFRSREFRRKYEYIVGGVFIGLVILGGWYVTGGPLGREWMEAVEFMDDPPPGTGTQSFTFIGPMADTLAYLTSPGNLRLITFGVAGVFGVMLGSFLYAVFSKGFRFEWFASFKDFLSHIAGAVLMGVGGVLGMGCTFGQGITGVSTLALGSFLVLVSIIFGSALTMKMQYYKMMYEGEAGWFAALITGLVDLHLLPKRLRKLEPV